ncbi:4Fe-4S dicluster domain-containing protein [Anoxynatronum buryatiense]|uniref:Fe-S-cluster-containing hydrogenase component 2 n=1 Tax=Anoxynatronum buryatiense TaxID=489973 RepID=A0AA46AHU4_9CLOT|nr:4Fe-4S dicluster domain-containing protein [Anoxynatronum buryatiense]SMP42699.1 Fe-S-cluster-containing hydrogenase component 2 [Anoxynatronum buryatiense]
MGLKFVQENCIGCKLCELACSASHEEMFNPRLGRLRVGSHYENKDLKIEGHVCILCGSCVRACPTDAIALEDGRLHYTREDCINCGVCVDVCPQSVIVQKEEDVGICDLCEGDPWCVKSCPHGALMLKGGTSA